MKLKKKRSRKLTQRPSMLKFSESQCCLQRKLTLKNKRLPRSVRRPHLKDFIRMTMSTSMQSNISSNWEKSTGQICTQNRSKCIWSYLMNSNSARSGHLARCRWLNKLSLNQWRLKENSSTPSPSSSLLDTSLSRMTFWIWSASCASLNSLIMWIKGPNYSNSSAMRLSYLSLTQLSLVTLSASLGSGKLVESNH